MAGDVFGNGMLLSRHIRLVAAFNHQHIFLDPDPDAARSFKERERLFNLPRSSWTDYDRAADLEGRRRVPTQCQGASRSRRRPARCSASKPRKRDAERDRSARSSSCRSTCCGTAASAPT